MSHSPQPHDIAWHALLQCLHTLDALASQGTDAPALADLRQQLKKAQAEYRHTLWHTWIQEWRQTYPNVPLNPETILTTIVHDQGAEWSDRLAFFHYLDHTYGRQADSLALAALIQAAKTLVSPRTMTRAALLNRCTLRLHLYLNLDYHTNKHTHLAWASHEPLRALSILGTLCVQHGAPHTTTAPPALTDLLHARGEITSHPWTIGPLTLKFFQNGRLDVTCSNATMASQLANLLLSTPTRPDPKHAADRSPDDRP